MDNFSQNLLETSSLNPNFLELSQETNQNSGVLAKNISAFSFIQNDPTINLSTINLFKSSSSALEDTYSIANSISPRPSIINSLANASANTTLLKTQFNEKLQRQCAIEANNQI